MDLISINQFSSLDGTKQAGEKLYNKNNFYKFLVSVMENQNIREGFNKYITDLLDVKTLIIYFKIYELVENHSKVKLDPFQKLLFVHMIMKDNETLSKIVNTLDRSLKSNKNKKTVCD